MSTRGNQSPELLKLQWIKAEPEFRTWTLSDSEPKDALLSGVRDSSVWQGLRFLKFYFIFITFTLLTSCPATEHTHLLALHLTLSKAFSGGGKLDGCWSIWTSFPVLLLLIILIDMWHWEMSNGLLRLWAAEESVPKNLSQHLSPGLRALGLTLIPSPGLLPSCRTGLLRTFCFLPLWLGAQCSLPGRHPFVLHLG